MPLPKHLPRQKPSSASAGRDLTSAGGRARSELVLANRYLLGDKLGSGAFGCAFLVSDLKSGKDRKVLKQIAVAELQPDETVDAVREARLLAKLDHPAIVKFHDSFMENDFFCIITEYCEVLSLAQGGDLDEKICKWKEAGKVFEETLVVDWFIQLTTAVRYIHERRILHRDLKTRNIFLKNNVIKLGDFGISRILMGTSDMATTFTGTPYYMSPEVLKHEGYNSKSDIWSLGVVLYELCTLNHAFQGQNLMAVMYKIVDGETPRLPDHFNSDLQSLFKRMMEKDPLARPSAIQILQEPFIYQRMEKLRGKMQLQRQTSSSRLAEEADAIARALSPVKKKNLVQNDGADLTPKQKMEIRKRLKSDQEAEERRQMAAKNFAEGRKRFKEYRKTQGRVVPPWVEEHPDVFNDPNFSISQLDSTASDCDPVEASVMEVSLKAIPKQLRDEIGACADSVVAMSFGGEGPLGIPADPHLAETHYSQFDDFEADQSSSSDSDDDYDAILDCIEDALDLPNQPVPTEAAPELIDHDKISPFTPLARKKRIAILKSQCLQIYGPKDFQRVYEFLQSARSSAAADEMAVLVGLRAIVSNTRDCFLVDQLVFLEKQAESSHVLL